MNRFERLSLGVAVLLGLASFSVSWLSWAAADAANRLALASGRPHVQVEEARVRFSPKVGERVVADMLLRNIGQREAVGISAWLAVTGQPSSMRAPVGLPMSLDFTQTVPPSGSVWIMVDTYNRWAEGDDAASLAIGGVVSYADRSSGSVYEQQVCFYTVGLGAAEQLRECGAVPTPESLRPFSNPR
jgi:hypothetical protein